MGTLSVPGEGCSSGTYREAPAAFDNRTNGFDPQGPAFDSIDEDNVVPLRSFNDNRFIFEEVETVADGLGPTFNAQACRECHQNIVTGGASQIAEHRTGRLELLQFVESIGGSLIQSRSTNPDIFERVPFEDSVSTLRISTNMLGGGFVEAIANSTLLAIRDRQPAADTWHGAGSGGARGQQLPAHRALRVEESAREHGVVCRRCLSERDGHHHAGAAGRKHLAGSLRGLRNSPSIRCRIRRMTASTWSRSPTSCVRPRRRRADPINATVRAGETLFNSVGCGGCHIPTIRTAAPGTRINGGAIRVRDAVGNKIIHPYSDFLLHDIGTGDGIPVLPGAAFASTATQIRTAPLWALRTRNRLMHDGLSFTKQEAITRHAGQAAGVRAAYDALTTAQKNQVLAFLDSL